MTARPIPPPVQDPRDPAAVFAELEANRPGYLPQWQPAAGGAGHAFLEILSRFAGITIEGLNAAPWKGFLSFLDAMGITLLPPSAARAPVVFGLAPGATTDSAVPAGTEVAASPAPQLPSTTGGQPGPPPPPPQPTVFATEEAISVARASLVAAYSLDPENELYANHTGQIGGAFTAFDTREPVPHALYLSHDSLFSLELNADLILLVNLVPRRDGRTNVPLSLVWEYFSDAGWVPFGDLVDGTNQLTRDGTINLLKEGGAKPTKTAIHGIQSFWVRGRIDDSSALRIENGQPPALALIRTILAHVTFGASELPLDAAFADRRRVDPTRDFQPFGAQPGLSSAFAFACDEAFHRADTEIKVTFTLSPGITPPAGQNGLKLGWEYSSGPNAWTSLISGSTQFQDSTASLTKDGHVKFLAPPDWAKVKFNGEDHYWVRVRILQGDYGGPVTFVLSGTTVKPDPASKPTPPSLSSVMTAYSVVTLDTLPERVLAKNLFQFDDLTEDCRLGTIGFQPFRPVVFEPPSFNLGFDLAPPQGLTSVFFDIGDPALAGLHAGPSGLTWEYQGPQGWQELPVLDETGGLQVGGMVQFVGPGDIQLAPGPSVQVYWIRARLKALGVARPAPIAGLHLNAAWAVQHQSVVQELAGLSDGSRRLSVVVQHPPILPGQIVEIQEWHGSGRAWESLFDDVAEDDLRKMTDRQGDVTEVWVRWHERPHLYSSTARQRVYTVERTRGFIAFGDGRAGMIPPPGTPIAVTYSTGGGQAGNVAAGAISQLRSPLPLVQSASNPIPATGGSPPERPELVAARGPGHLSSGGRAVTGPDYEWLAREASPEVALAHCLPAWGPDGVAQPGWVTVVVAPTSDATEPQPSGGLLREVRVALAAAAPAAISSQIRVVPPSYTQVSVRAELVAATSQQLDDAERGARKALDDFLQPLTGGPQSAGWDFGATVHRSQVARVLRGVAGVIEVGEVLLAAQGSGYRDSVELEATSLPSAGNHLLRVEAPI